MIFETDGYEIRNNFIHDVCYSDEQGEWAIGIALYTSGCNVPDRPSDCPNALEDPIYSRNGKVHHNIITRIGLSGIYASGHDVEMFANTISNIGLPRRGGHGIMVLVENDYETIERLEIYNNLIHDGLGYGVWLITLAGGSNRTHPTFLRDIHVVNNTIVRMGEPDWWGGGMLVEDGPKSGVVLRNNITAWCRVPVDGWDNEENRVPGGPFDNVAIDHNLFFGTLDDDPTHGVTKGRDYVEGDPLFVNPVIPDFRLRSSSPAIDRGPSEQAPATDYEGRRRPQGAGYDIGAFEF